MATKWRTDLSSSTTDKNRTAVFLEKAIEFAKGNPEAFVIGIILFFVGTLVFFLYAHSRSTTLMKATNAFEEAIKTYNEPIVSKETPGPFHSAEEKYKKTTQMFKDIIDKYRGAEAAEKSLFYLGTCQYENRFFDEAIATYRDYLSKYKNKLLPSSAQLSIGKCYLEKKDYLHAKEEFQKLLKDFPDDYLTAEALFSVGLVSELMGDKKSAEEAFQKVMSLYLSSPWARKAKERVPLPKAYITPMASTSPVAIVTSPAVKPITTIQAPTKATEGMKPTLPGPVIKRLKDSQ